MFVVSKYSHVKISNDAYSAARRSRSRTMFPPGTDRRLSGFSIEIPLKTIVINHSMVTEKKKGNSTFFHHLQTKSLSFRHRSHHHHHHHYEVERDRRPNFGSCFRVLLYDLAQYEC